MIIRVDRYLSTSTATLSQVYVDEQMICYGLEDGKHFPKIPGKTRIHAGAYKTILRKVGGMHDRYLKRFGPEFHKGMLWLQDVPDFQYILIHIGNTVQDTEGCLLLGLGRDETRMTVSASEAAYRKLYPMVVDVAENGHLLVHIEDGD